MGVGGRSSIDPYDGFHPYLSSLVSGSPLGAVLHVHIARRSYLGTNKGPQVPPISQCWSAKWWNGSTEMERPAHPVCAVSHRFGNRGHDCLNPCEFCYVVSRRFGNRGHDCLWPCDFHCAVTAHGEL
jgi:hypothetical protein